MTLRPLRDFRLDPVGELRGRAGDRLEAERHQTLPEFRHRDDAGDLAMQEIDDLLRRAGRRQQAGQDVGFERLPGGLRHGRHVGQERGALALISASARNAPLLA